MTAVPNPTAITIVQILLRPPWIPAIPAQPKIVKNVIKFLIVKISKPGADTDFIDKLYLDYLILGLLYFTDRYFYLVLLGISSTK